MSRSRPSSSQAKDVVAVVPASTRKGGRKWTLVSDRAFDKNTADVTGHWLDLATAFEIFLLDDRDVLCRGGKPGDQWVRWQFYSQNIDLLLQIWREAKPRHPMHQVLEAHKSEYKIQPVTVCRAGGALPNGEYMDRLSVRADRLDGLMVQILGHRNKQPCDCCAARCRSSLMGDVNVDWPFADCISMPDVFDGTCGNCLYHIDRPSCNFWNDNESKVVQQNRAPRSSSFRGHKPRDFSRLKNLKKVSAKAFIKKHEKKLAV